MPRDFNGSSHELQIQATADLRPSLPVSISAFVNLDDATDGAVFHNNRVGSTYCGVWLELVSGVIYLAYGDNGGSGSTDRRTKQGVTSLPIGRDVHVAGVIRGATDMDIYIDGKADSGSYTGSGSALAYNTGNGSRIGSLSGVGFINGRIGHVAFWSVDLGAEEVFSLRQKRNPREIRPENLLAYWPLNDYIDAGISKNLTRFNHDATGVVPLVPDTFSVGQFNYLTAAGTSTSSAEDNTDAAVVYLDIQPSTVTDIADYVDSTTVTVTITPILTFEEHTTFDSAEVYVDLQPSALEIYSPPCLIIGDGEAELRWTASDNSLRWEGYDSNPRWDAYLKLGTGQC